MTTALVTGATGFIGSHLVDRLLVEGYEVTALVRKTSNLRWINHKPIRMVTGEIRSPESLVPAVKGQDIIFHVAGAIKGKNFSDFASTNYQGTENIMKTILKHNPNVQKVIYVSSLACGGPTIPTHPLTEDDPSRPLTAYGKTKYAGEKVVLSYSNYMHVVAIRPPTVYGSRDRGILNFFQLVLKHVKVNPGLRDKYASMIHVSDLVRALTLMAKGETKNGNFYYVNDGIPEWSWLELQQKIADVLETWTITLRIPLTFILLMSTMGHIVQWLTRKPKWVNLTKYRQFIQPAWTCDSSRITTELGYHPKMTLEDGIRETAEWYRQIGWIT